MTMAKRLTVQVTWQRGHSSKVLPKAEGVKVAFSFGHLEMVDEKRTIAIATDTPIRFGHCRYRAQLKAVWCLGIPRNAAPHWRRRTVQAAATKGRL